MIRDRTGFTPVSLLSVFNPAPVVILIQFVKSYHFFSINTILLDKIRLMMIIAFHSSQGMISISLIILLYSILIQFVKSYHFFSINTILLDKIRLMMIIAFHSSQGMISISLIILLYSISYRFLTRYKHISVCSYSLLPGSVYYYLYLSLMPHKYCQELPDVLSFSGYGSLHPHHPDGGY